MGIKLDIGCGAKLEDGYTGVDAYVTGPGIVNAPMWALPYDDDTVEEIRSSHALEHVAKRMVPVTLLEWRRVLIPGGRLLLFVPDLEWCVTEWLKRKDTGWHLDTIFGNQDHQGEFHLTGFTDDIAYNYLDAAGFSDIVVRAIVSHRQRTIAISAVA
jgi:predicted SAM-dependent methyltransferase